MSSAIVDLVKHALMITGFVAVMMLLVEYANVLSRGGWLAGLRRGGLRATLSAAGLGVMPGCLGAFAVVAMYTHGQLSFGSVVAAMVATSGDEAFVMLALAPRDALWLFALLAALGFGAGLLTDALRRPRANTPTTCTDLDLQPHELSRRAVNAANISAGRPVAYAAKPPFRCPGPLHPLVELIDETTRSS